MVIAPNKFRDEEYFEPKALFEEAGAKVVTASKGTRRATGMLGGSAGVDLELSKADAADYAAVVFVGGVGAAIYFNDPAALALAKAAAAQRKVVAAICIAPSILANAGLLKGLSATSFPSEEANLVAKGVRYTGEAVTVDGLIVTARDPKAARLFGKTVLDIITRKTN